MKELAMGLFRSALVIVTVVSLWPCMESTGLMRADEPEFTIDNADEFTSPLAKAITVLGIREDGTRYIVSRPRLLMKVYDTDRGRNGGRIQQGAIWAWGTGRPVAITEFWRWKDVDTWGHTFISTTPGRLVANFDDHSWQPEQPGLRFQRLEGSPTPADTVEDRTPQMINLAKRFSGYEITRPRKVVDLSIVDAPIDRYQTDGIDGAIFALSHEDNPEALLFVESVSDPIGPSYWRFAWAKCTSSAVFVELDGTEVVQIPGELNYLGSDKEPFWVLFRNVSLPQQ